MGVWRSLVLELEPEAIAKLKTEAKAGSKDRVYQGLTKTRNQKLALETKPESRVENQNQSQESKSENPQGHAQRNRSKSFHLHPDMGTTG